jgi:arginyl-tRNA synthetase
MERKMVSVSEDRHGDAIELAIRMSSETGRMVTIGEVVEMAIKNLKEKKNEKSEKSHKAEKTEKGK